MANGKITLKGVQVGSLVGGIVGNIIETAVNLTGTALKKGAELGKKGLDESRKAIASGLEKSGEAISDDGIAKRKLSKAERELRHAQELQAKYGRKTEPEIVHSSEASNAIVVK